MQHCASLWLQFLQRPSWCKARVITAMVAPTSNCKHPLTMVTCICLTYILSILEWGSPRTASCNCCSLQTEALCLWRLHVFLQVDAWRLHTCKEYAQHWVVGQHHYIIKSAISSGLMRVIHDNLSEVKPNQSQIY